MTIQELDKFLEDYDSDDLIRVTCADCGIVFGLSKQLYRLRRIDQDYFYCPNKHGMSFVEEITEEVPEIVTELKDKNAILLARIDQLQAEIEHLKSHNLYAIFNRHIFPN